jgi:DNA-directed RNA polymerase specialized sigma24 family protein
MNGQARALIESMPNDIGTEAVGPLSFDEAFTLHHRAVFRTARAVVRDSALAEDVTQEVFLRLPQKTAFLLKRRKKTTNADWQSKKHAALWPK